MSSSLSSVKVGAKSKTVIGGVIALIPALNALLGEVAKSPIVDPKTAAVIGAAGAALAIFGRFAAKKKVRGIFGF